MLRLCRGNRGGPGSYGARPTVVGSRPPTGQPGTLPSAAASARKAATEASC
ncbi:MAG: hypothetical protein JWR63_94, partial [Conexibacter sp.]|nr:hypothetical protein [Conexibacter sp.]